MGAGEHQEGEYKMNYVEDMEKEEREVGKMEDMKFEPKGMNWGRMEEAAWQIQTASKKGEDEGLLERVRTQLVGRIDDYIRDGGFDRDITELDSMFVDVKMVDRINAIGSGGASCAPGKGDPTVVAGTSGRYGHRLVLKYDDMDDIEPSGKKFIAWWAPCSRGTWMCATVCGKTFLSGLVSGLASREGSTTMDALRKTYVDRLVAAEKAMYKRVERASVEVRYTKVPKEIWDYVKRCESEVLGEEEL